MEELEIFKKRVQAYVEKAYNGGVGLFPFLDEPRIEIILSEIKRNPKVFVEFYGGILNSDRVRAILSSYPVEKEDFKITVFQIIYNKQFNTVSHRSILGSLLALGIKRECIGDIVIDEGNNAYFATTKELEQFLIDEFHSVGKTPVELKKTDYPIENKIRYESKVYFLASLRLDAVISAVYHLSRKESLEMIQNGLVSVFHTIIFNSSHNVKKNDEISVRHKGKIKVMKIGNLSKSGRIVVTLGKRI